MSKFDREIMNMYC